MVILFGSYARDEWVEKKYLEEGITYEYQSDFDILVVVQNEYKIKAGTGKRIRREARKAKVATPITLIFHEVDFLNKELGEGSYFFTDIRKEGIMLHDSGRFTLNEPRDLSAAERQKISKQYFDEWFKSAEDFYKYFDIALSNGDNKIAVFNLHQATEKYFFTTLLVFTHYKPKTHDLEMMSRRTGQLNAEFKKTFPRKTNEEERLFDLLKRAYVDARYKMGYKVEKSDLEKLAVNVRKLRELTERICSEEIGRIID